MTQHLWLLLNLNFFQVSFKDFIEQQKLDHIEALEAEKQAREKAKKETLLQETRYGAKPSTPARLKGKEKKDIYILTLICNFQASITLKHQGKDPLHQVPQEFFQKWWVYNLL